MLTNQKVMEIMELPLTYKDGAIDYTLIEKLSKVIERFIATCEVSKAKL